MEPAFKGLEINDLLELPGPTGSTLWISCFGKGLAHWDLDRVTFVDRGKGLPLDFPVCLAWTRDSGNRPSLWVGSYNDGLAYLCNDRWVHLTTNQGLRSQGVYALQADPSGKPALWIGMQGGGVSSLSIEGWMSLQRGSSGFPGAGTTCFLESPEAEGTLLWFGTQRGLVWFSTSAPREASSGSPSSRTERPSPRSRPLAPPRNFRCTPFPRRSSRG